MDLIVHVGLGKTGTTALQVQTFSNFEGFLGAPQRFGKHDGAAGLEDEYRRACLGAVVDLQSWRAKVLATFDDHLPDRVILSQERLANWWMLDGGCYTPVLWLMSDRGLGRREGRHPLASFIRDALIPAWRPLGEVRILLTLRNQYDWLSSHYAQLSNRLVGASQADFERQVWRIVRSGDRYLDFADLAESLSEAVGRKYLTVLLHEDMNSERYWRSLSGLLGKEILRPERDADHENRRSSTRGWELRPRDRTKYPLRREVFGRISTSGQLREWTVRGVIPPGRVLAALFQPRGTHIAEDPALRTAIQRAYRESNNRLGHFLDRDLAELGY